MTKEILKNKFLVVLAFIFVSTNVFAFDGDRGGHSGRHHDGGHYSGRGHGSSYHRGGHSHYYYHGGRWYTSDAWIWGSIAAALAIGAIVATLPPSCEKIYVRGTTYYYCDNVYYRRTPNGYIVVRAP